MAGPGYKLLWNILPISLEAARESAETEAKLLLVLLPLVAAVAEETDAEAKEDEGDEDDCAAAGRGSILLRPLTYTSNKNQKYNM